MDMKHGHFFWNELMTWKAEEAKSFFADTLGWTYEAFGEGDSYWVIMDGEQPLGGIMPMTPEMEDAPDQWVAYICVDDIDARLAKVVDAGGKVVRPPFEIPSVGRIAMLEDPSGAIIGWITPEECPEHEE